MKKNNKFKDLLLRCLAYTEQQVVGAVYQRRVYGYRVVQAQKYIVLVPKDEVVYPLICAHYDTVRSERTPLELVVKGNIISNNRGVLGGDDRAGVAIALSLLDSGIKAIYAFFDEEECGAHGSDQFVEQCQDILKRVNCYIGLDRRNDKDMAVYDYSSKELMSVWSAHGYKKAMGSFTDVSNIAKSFPKPTINLSVGFRSEHMSTETQNISDAYNTLEACYISIPGIAGYTFTDLACENSFRFDYDDYPYGDYASSCYPYSYGKASSYSKSSTAYLEKASRYLEEEEEDEVWDDYIGKQYNPYKTPLIHKGNDILATDINSECPEGSTIGEVIRFCSGCAQFDSVNFDCGLGWTCYTIQE